MNRCIVAAAVALCATAGWAQANPSLSYTWDSCTGPIQKSSTGPGSYSLYVSVTGLEAPHKAYEAWFSLASAQGDVPDAWRFDDAGCQGPAAIRFCPPSPLDMPALTASCPPAWGKGRFLSLNGVRQASTVDDASVPPNGLVFLLANAYDDVLDSDPNQRYALYRVDFDHTLSVEGPGTPGETCGGFEHDMYIRAIPARCNWLTVAPEGSWPQEVRFDVPQAYARFGDKEAASGEVPAALTTWGQIKAQFRR